MNDLVGKLIIFESQYTQNKKVTITAGYSSYSLHSIDELYKFYNSIKTYYIENKKLTFDKIDNPWNLISYEFNMTYENFENLISNKPYYILNYFEVKVFDQYQETYRKDPVVLVLYIFLLFDIEKHCAIVVKKFLTKTKHNFFRCL